MKKYFLKLKTTNQMSNSPIEKTISHSSENEATSLKDSPKESSISSLTLSDENNNDSIPEHLAILHEEDDYFLNYYHSNIINKNSLQSDIKIPSTEVQPPENETQEEDDKQDLNCCSIFNSFRPW